MCIFFVDPEQLLRGTMRRLHRTEHSLLYDRGTIRIDHQRPRVDPKIAEHFAQHPPVAIGADDAQRAGPRA